METKNRPGMPYKPGEPPDPSVWRIEIPEGAGDVEITGCYFHTPLKVELEGDTQPIV